MNLKILRLTLHSHAPMRGDAAKLRGFFATSYSEHPLSAGIKYQYRLGAITMKTLRYKILLRKEDDGTYTVIVPSLPGCLTFGRTVEEALAMAKEAIEGFIACMIARGEEVPIETDDSMICTIAVEANA